MNYIRFPGLNLEFYIKPVAFTVFGKDIYLYGLIIATGLILAAVFCSRLMKKEGMPSDTAADIVLYATPVAIVCARLYYVIFNFGEYKDNLWSIFAIWNGGIAIYGAIIGAVTTAYIYCKKKNLDYKKVFDIGVLGLLIGQMIGRWGNFVNAEAYGSITTVPWRMEIIETGKSICVHPTFLYESLWNLLGFILLMCYRKHKKFDGEIFLMYVGWYGFGRAIIEGLRTDSLYIGIFRISQLVGIASFVVALALIIINRKRVKNQ